MGEEEPLVFAAGRAWVAEALPRLVGGGSGQPTVESEVYTSVSNDYLDN